MAFKKYLVFVMTIIIPVQTEHIITTLKYSNRYRVKPTIVNGITAELGETPYVVSIKGRQIEDGTYEMVWSNICGGGIFGNKLVLTAAHCFEENDFNFAKHPQTLRIVAGALKNHLRVEDNLMTPKIQWRHIKKVTLHEHFHFPDNDIAIVTVDRNWIYTPTVNVVPVATKRSELHRECHTAGYGRLGHAPGDEASRELLVARVKTMPTWQCAELWQINMDKYICSDSVTTDVSQGDSGSPMVCISASKSESQPVIEGIVCGKNFDKTTLYTRVSAFNDWISKNMACNIHIHNMLLSITIFLTH